MSIKDSEKALKIPTPRKDLVESEELIGQQLFLYDESSKVVHCLNSGGAMVWLLCDGSRDVDTIAREIAATAPSLSTEQVQKEVRETVDQFHSLGLV